MTSSDYVLDFRQKAVHLKQKLFSLHKLGANTFVALASHAGIGKDALKTSAAERNRDNILNNDLYFWKPSRDIQEKLAAVGNFDYTKPPWSSLGVPHNLAYKDRPDNHQAFKNYLDKALPKKESSATPHYLSIQPNKPDNCDTDFASLSLEGTEQDTQPGQKLRLLMDTSFNSASIEPDVKIGLRMVRLRLHFSQTTGMTATSRIGKESTDRLSKDNVQISRSGNSWKPIWRFTVTEGFLSTLVTHDAPLCLLENATEGDLIRVTMDTDLWDDSIVPENEKQHKNEDVLRQRLIQLLKNMGVGLVPNKGGWVPLGEQTLRIIANEIEEE